MERPYTQLLYKDEFYWRNAASQSQNSQYPGLQPLHFSGDAYLHESALSIQNLIKCYLGFNFVVVIVLRNIRKSLHTS